MNAKLKVAVTKPDPIDVHVGSRIRLRRTLLNMSQEKLASALGITFQQVQKYESGANRVGASRLFQISQAFDVPVSFFFEGYANDKGNQLQAAEERKGLEDDVFDRKETLDLLRAYYSIEDMSVRKKIFEMIKSLNKPQ